MESGLESGLKSGNDLSEEKNEAEMEVLKDDNLNDNVEERGIVDALELPSSSHESEIASIEKPEDSNLIVDSDKILEKDSALNSAGLVASGAGSGPVFESQLSISDDEFMGLVEVAEKEMEEKILSESLSESHIEKAKVDKDAEINAEEGNLIKNSLETPAEDEVLNEDPGKDNPEELQTSSDHNQELSQEDNTENSTKFVLNEENVEGLDPSEVNKDLIEDVNLGISKSSEEENVDNPETCPEIISSNAMSDVNSDKVEKDSNILLDDSSDLNLQGKNEEPLDPKTNEHLLEENPDLNHEKECEESLDQKTDEGLNEGSLESETVKVDDKETFDVDFEPAVTQSEIPSGVGESVENNEEQPSKTFASTSVEIEAQNDTLTDVSDRAVPGKAPEEPGKPEAGNIPTKTECEKKPNLKEGTSTESKEPKFSISDTPEDLLNLLKQLTPEKLLAVKSQILSTVLGGSAETSLDLKPVEKMEVDETPEPKENPVKVEEVSMPTIKPEEPEKKSDEIPALETKSESSETAVNKPELKPEVSIEKKPEDADDVCIVLLDSDEEDGAKPSEQPKPVEMKKTDVKVNGAAPKRKSDESKENMAKRQAKSKDCVNPECPRDSNDFMECPRFILSFYFSSKKTQKVQFVCAPCFDKALIKYEEMGEALLNCQPLHLVPTHKKQEMVEVIDSDDEDEPEKLPYVPDSQKILFDRNTEIFVEEILQNLVNQMDLKQQFKLEKKDLKIRSKKLDEAQAECDRELKELERKSSRMYNDLYSSNKQRVQRRTSVHISDDSDPKPKEPALPVRRVISSAALSQALKSQKSSNVQITPKITMTPGTKIVIHPPKQTNPELICYAARPDPRGRMQCFSQCKLIESLTGSNGPKKYRVMFVDSEPNSVAVVDGKHFALNNVDTKLTIGARVITTIVKKDKEPRYIPGVIGEKLSKYNKFRYLVFCDSGQVVYSPPSHVREISEVSQNVWEDVHENLRQFIRDYLQSQTNGQRALLNVRLNQTVSTERYGHWRNAVVKEIDCSIVKMFFPFDHTHEWLYRGSKRLAPIFNQANHRGSQTNARRNDPLISYITIDDDFDQQPAQQVNQQAAPEQASGEVKRNTARKSTAPAPPQQQQTRQPPIATWNTSGPAPAPQQQPVGVQQPIILNDNSIYLEDPEKITKFRHFTPRKDICAKQYFEHTCSPSCLMKSPNLSIYSPLAKPLLTCWERQIVRYKTNKWVTYKAPCGRLLRNMYEIWQYLTATKCQLNVDNFSLDESMQVLASHELDKEKLDVKRMFYTPDMSEGKEGMKIPIINAFDLQKPPPLEYSAVRIPMENVNINTDPEFLACCDCTDDCSDKTKCACFQMTIQGVKYAHRGERDMLIDDDISYVWKRLVTQVPTGIYECNSRCKCSSRCLNKVVQQPIQVKMQLFRTKNCGWGLECCHDIPKGTFICNYVGRLYREEDANNLCAGLTHGDEYFAELDIIETASPLKEGYEPGVIYPDSESDADKASDSDSDYDEKKDQDDVDFVSRPRNVGNREIVTRSTRNDKSKNTPSGSKQTSDSDTDDGEMVSMLPVGNAGGNQPKYRSLRKLFGKGERPYVMDAKHCGNVGRYFNHSCDPNLFVQSVFVDTHDMRFPWIAFFSNRSIKAGEELTWNYNYEVGSVPLKVLYCKCGAKNCRGRIL